MYVNFLGHDGEKVSRLMFNHDQWQQLYNQIYQKADEGAEKENKNKELLKRKEMSMEMAKSWDNTYINIRRRRYEKRKERLKKEKELKEKLNKKITAENEKIQNEIREKAKERGLYQQDSTKTFHTAFRMSEVLAERKAQLDFNEKLKKIDIEIETKYAQSIIDDSKRYEEEQAEEERKKTELKQILGNEARVMYAEAEKRRIAEREKQNKEDREDMEILKRQQQQVVENERNEIARQKKILMRSLVENRELVKKNKQIAKLEEEEENNAIQIIANGKMRIAKIRKEKEDKMLQEKRSRYQKLSNTIEQERKERLQKEEEIYQHAFEQKNKRELDAREKEKQYREMLRDERIKAHLEQMKNQEERLAIERELLKWEILNRFKREEINNQFVEKVKEEKRKNILQRRYVFKEQIESDLERKIREKEIELEAAKKAQENWEMNDKEFLEYAYRVREESKNKGKDTYPLDAAIYEFKKKHLLDENARNFIKDAKLMKPEGIKDMHFVQAEEEKEQPQVCKCAVRSFRNNVLEREDCGCPKKANGL